MKYFTQITFGEHLVEVFAARIEALSGLGDQLSDKSLIGKNAGCHVIAHFQIEIVEKLFEDIDITEAIDDRALVVDCSCPVIFGHQYNNEMI
jgi:hypothetical protein